jgi:hypothetical protein
MTVTGNLLELALRSSDADWNRERWEMLPDDGNRYEVIDGVLRSYAPSPMRRWATTRRCSMSLQMMS